MATTSYKSMINDQLECLEHLTDFQSYIDDSKSIVKGKCENLRHDIEINIQNLIKKVNKQQDPLVFEVNAYEKKCLSEADEKIDKAKLLLNLHRNQADKNIKLLNEDKDNFRKKNSIIEKCNLKKQTKTLS
jgi:hypothetical protein